MGRLDNLHVTLTKNLRAYLERHPEDVEHINRALIKAAIAGKIQALELIYERLDGKVSEHVQIEGVMPIRLVFVSAGHAVSELPGEAVPIDAQTPLSLPAPEGEVGLGGDGYY